MQMDEAGVQQLLFAAADRLPEETTVPASVPSRQAGVAQSIARCGPYVRCDGPVAQLDRTRLQQPSQVRKLEDPVGRTTNLKSNNATAGPMWFDLPETSQTPEVMRDLRLLANRNVLDPHRHYKKESRKTAIPKFSQVGTVIEGPTEFISGRISKKERKQTLADDLLAGEKSHGKFKSKFEQLQQVKASGRSRHKKLKSRHKR